MTIIATKTLVFTKKGGPTGEMNHLAKPAPGPQEAPDWIRDTETFGFASKDGSVVEISRVTPKAVKAAKSLEAPESLQPAKASRK